MHDFEELAYAGFLPRVHEQSQCPDRAYANYYQTYVERDVRQLIQQKDATLFEKTLKLLAGRTGQLVDFSSLANDVGVDANGNEVDLLIPGGGELKALEIKSAATFKMERLKGLRRFRSLARRPTDNYLIYNGESRTLSEQTRALNFREVHSIFTTERDR